MEIAVIVLIVSLFAFELVLSILDFRNRMQPVPDNVRSVYDQEAYSKWLDYSMANFRLSLFEKSFHFLVLVVLLLSGFFGFLERLTDSWMGDGTILATLAFLGLYYVLRLVTDLPFDYYRTFIIEERFGFNKQTRSGFISDQIKSLLLVVILGGGLVTLLMVFYRTFSNAFFVFAWLALVVIFFLVLILYTKVFIPLFNKLEPLEEGELREAIEAFVSDSGYRIKAISRMDASKRSTKLNAFFSGMGRFKRIVLFDTLIDKMSTDEIVAVLAHEIAHDKNKDTVRIFLQQILMLAIYTLVIAWTVSSDALAQAFGLSGAHFGFGLLLFTILIDPVLLLLSPLTNHLSRIAEYRADRYAAEHGYRQAMHDALIKLARENFSNLTPHPLYVFFYYDHPTISDRLRSLEATKGTPSNA
ncbi:MAG: M48 family metallopeptidase [Acholeplasmataceae bacterium]